MAAHNIAQTLFASQILLFGHVRVLRQLRHAFLGHDVHFLNRYIKARLKVVDRVDRLGIFVDFRYSTVRHDVFRQRNAAFSVVVHF